MAKGQGVNPDTLTSTTACTGDTTCPFFLAHGPREIQCEGYGEGVKTIHRFVRTEGKAWWKLTYCDGGHRSCEHYRSLMVQKYDENPDQYWRGEGRKNMVKARVKRKLQAHDLMAKPPADFQPILENTFVTVQRFYRNQYGRCVEVEHEGRTYVLQESDLVYHREGASREEILRQQREDERPC